MPATKKVTGFLVKIEAFVPADLTDQKLFTTIQSTFLDAVLNIEKLGTAGLNFSITPTRR